MKVEKDYEEFLRLLNRNKVRYCIVGAYALAFYAEPRYTKDMDILIAPSAANARAILKTLHQFGFGELELSEKDFIATRRIIQLGYEPVRIDLLTSIPSCTFARVWKNRKIGYYGDEKTYFISLDDLLRNKKASRRTRDHADAELLSLIKKRKQKRFLHRIPSARAGSRSGKGIRIEDRPKRPRRQ